MACPFAGSSLQQLKQSYHASLSAASTTSPTSNASAALTSSAPIPIMSAAAGTPPTVTRIKSISSPGLSESMKQHRSALLDPSFEEFSLKGTPTPSPPAGHSPHSPHGHLPHHLWTGGMRTSLGVENTHALDVWLKEMKLKESSDPSLNDKADKGDSMELKERDKNWKQKRDRPPILAAMHGTAGATGEMDAGIGDRPRFHGPYTTPPRYTREITYWDYIHPEVLTSLQTGRDGKGLNHHDEHLFILVHQVFELWFKQIIWELEYIRNALCGYADPAHTWYEHPDNYLLRCNQRLMRCDKIMRLITTMGYEVMETMNPSDFLEFRDFLSPSSGFQSVQLREIEILMGLKDEERLPCAGRHYREAFMANADDKTGIFDIRLREKTLKDALYILLSHAIPSTQLQVFLAAYFAVLQTQSLEKYKDFEEELALLTKMTQRTQDTKELQYLHDLMQKATFGRKLARNSCDDVERFFMDETYGKQRTACLFLMTYHAHPLFRETAALLNNLLMFEQAVILWRSRHARMVEVFIGRRPGTGGSSGVEYIDNTATQYRVFTDLWRIRSLVVARSKIQFDPDHGAVAYGLQGLGPTSTPPMDEKAKAALPALPTLTADRTKIMCEPS